MTQLCDSGWYDKKFQIYATFLFLRYDENISWSRWELKSYFEETAPHEIYARNCLNWTVFDAEGSFCSERPCMAYMYGPYRSTESL